MQESKSEKVAADDDSSLFGAMKGAIKIHGDISSTGCWPSDEEMEASYREMAADMEAEAEALEWIDGTMGDVGDEPWDFEDD